MGYAVTPHKRRKTTRKREEPPDKRRKYAAFGSAPESERREALFTQISKRA